MKPIQIILLILTTFYSLFANSERDLGPRPVLDKTKVAELIVYYTNIERVKRGLNLLEYNPVLTSAAEIHSKYMFDNQVLTHYESKLNSPVDRVEVACKDFEKDCMSKFEVSEEKKRGYFMACCGENVIESFADNSAGVSFRYKKDEKGTYKEWKSEIHWYSEEEIAKDLVNRWMDSPGHRANILHKDFSAIGAAISDYADKGGMYYGTQVFAPTPTDEIKTQEMKFDPFQKLGEIYNTTLDGGEVLEKYTLILTKISGESILSTSKKNKLYPIQISNFKTETVILIEIQDLTNSKIRYPYWKFKITPTDSVPKLDWINWEK